VEIVTAPGNRWKYFAGAVILAVGLHLENLAAIQRLAGVALDSQRGRRR
jgi:hypothetical protein